MANASESIKLKQLRCFVRTVEAGNITQAARHLNLAQTALGLQIRNLEESLGVALLVRHSRGISASEAGQLFYERAVSILALIDEMHREVSALATATTETVTIGMTPSILRLIGPDLLVEARSALPDVSIRLVEELSFALVDTLLRNEVDLALAYDVGDTQGLIRTALIEEDLLFITAPGPDNDGAPIRFREAVASDLALASDRDVVWLLVHDTARRLQLPVNVAFRVQSTEAIKQLVARGAATSIVPFGLIADEIEKGTIAARPIERPTVKRTLFLVRSSTGKRLRNERALMALLGTIVDWLSTRIGRHASQIGDILEEAKGDLPES